jgi:hypothetical protein
MINISHVKSRAGAIKMLEEVAFPVVDESMKPDQKALTEKKIVFFTAVRDLALARLNTIAETVEVVNVIVRAEYGDIELITIRIIQHK